MRAHDVHKTILFDGPEDGVLFTESSLKLDDGTLLVVASATANCLVGCLLFGSSHSLSCKSTIATNVLSTRLQSELASFQRLDIPPTLSFLFCCNQRRIPITGSFEERLWSHKHFCNFLIKSFIYSQNSIPLMCKLHDDAPVGEEDHELFN